MKLKRQKNFSKFVKKNKKGISFAIGTIGVVLTGVGIYKLVVCEPQKYSLGWFKKASDELLAAERERVQQQCCSAGDNFSEAVRLENMLGILDSVIDKRKRNGEEYGYPVPRENGWYLSNDD